VGRGAPRRKASGRFESRGHTRRTCDPPTGLSPSRSCRHGKTTSGQSAASNVAAAGGWHHPHTALGRHSRLGRAEADRHLYRHSRPPGLHEHAARVAQVTDVFFLVVGPRGVMPQTSSHQHYTRRCIVPIVAIDNIEPPRCPPDMVWAQLAANWLNPFDGARPKSSRTKGCGWASTLGGWRWVPEFIESARHQSHFWIEERPKKKQTTKPHAPARGTASKPGPCRLGPVATVRVLTFPCSRRCIPLGPRFMAPGPVLRRYESGPTRHRKTALRHRRGLSLPARRDKVVVGQRRPTAPRDSPKSAPDVPVKTLAGRNCGHHRHQP